MPQEKGSVRSLGKALELLELLNRTSTFKYLSATPRPKPSTAPSTSIIITATITIFILPSLDYELDCLYRHNPYIHHNPLLNLHTLLVWVFFYSLNTKQYRWRLMHQRTILPINISLYNSCKARECHSHDGSHNQGDWITNECIWNFTLFESFTNRLWSGM